MIGESRLPERFPGNAERMISHKWIILITRVPAELGEIQSFDSLLDARTGAENNRPVPRGISPAGEISSSNPQRWKFSATYASISTTRSRDSIARLDPTSRSNSKLPNRCGLRLCAALFESRGLIFSRTNGPLDCTLSRTRALFNPNVRSHICAVT